MERVCIQRLKVKREAILPSLIQLLLDLANRSLITPLVPFADPFGTSCPQPLSVLAPSGLDI